MTTGTDLGVLSVPVHELLPGKIADNGYQNQRVDGYGDTFVQQWTPRRAAQEGSYFVVQNATAGTGVAQTANTTQDATHPFIGISVPGTQGKSFYLDYIMMKPTAVSSGQTTQNLDIIVCAGTATLAAGTDYSAKATGIGTAGYRSPNTNVVGSSMLANLRVGAPTAVLGTDARQLVHAIPRDSVIPVAGDQYILVFGREGGFTASGDIAGTTAKQIVIPCPPVIVAPGYAMLFIPWAASVAGAMSWEFEMGWWER